MPFLRTVNTEVAELAQQRTAEVLALAFQQIDERVASIRRRIEDAVRAKSFVMHRNHEHHLQKSCECELCAIYNEIDYLKRCRHAATYPRSWRCDFPSDNYVVQLDRRLFELHNLRRTLMGLPIREWKPKGSQYRYRHETTGAVPVRVG